MEDSDGRVYFWIPETPWPLDIALEAVSVRDLPDPYSREEAEATLLPVQEAAGTSEHEAFQRMLTLLDALASRGVAALRGRRLSA
jgi:hypothetical protein